MAQVRPLREEDVKSGGRSSINGEGGDYREGQTKAVGEKKRVGGGG